VGIGESAGIQDLLANVLGPSIANRLGCFLRAAVSDDFARLPAAGEVAVSGRSTALISLVIQLLVEPLAIDLGTAMPREDLKESLPLRIVIRGAELIIEACGGGRMDAPTCSVGDD
jgi:hypothetical protein